MALILVTGWMKMNLSPPLATVKTSTRPRRGRKVKSARWLTALTTCVINEFPMRTLPQAFQPTTTNNVFNIQLNYDIDQALDPESWDGEFRAVSLHGSMEHLVSDVKNIKESLRRMGNYIKDKSVNSNPNDVKDLDGMGKAVWEFLSTVYDAHWDGLYVDDSKMLFRNKVKSKLNPQAPRTPVNNKGKKTVKPTYVSPSLYPSRQRLPKKSMRFQNTSRRMTNLRRSHTLKLLPNPRAPMPP